MDGILIVDKPKGYTSHDIVSIVRKELNIKKIGHAGTLDPNATGVLPILVGKATKISQYLIEHNKEYFVTITLGKQTDTGDIEGNIIKEDNRKFNLSNEEIILCLESFKGEKEQIPPIYSAIKVNGKKAYEYARQGKEVQLKARTIEIFNISLVKYVDNKLVLDVLCSKGTYIRSLAEDIAKSLGTIGYVEELRRTRVDKFKIENANTLDNIKNNKETLKFISIESIFENNSKIDLNERKFELFLNGVKLTVNEPDGLYRVYKNNIFVGLGIIEKKLLKRDVII